MLEDEMHEQPVEHSGDARRPERVAVIAVHGVADQLLGATARDVAGLLANGPGLSATYRTETCDSFITRVALIEPMSDGKVAAKAPDFIEVNNGNGSFTYNLAKRDTDEAQNDGAVGPASPVQKALHQSVRSDFQRSDWMVKERSTAPGKASPGAPLVPTTTSNPDIADRGVEFTDYLLFKAISKTESDAYEVPRIRMTREDAAGRQQVDIHEMYWADLSRLSGALPRILTEIFTMIFRLSRLGRDTVDEASRAARTVLEDKVRAIEARRAAQNAQDQQAGEKDDAELKGVKLSIRRWGRLASTQIALDWAFSSLLAQLFMQLLVVGLLIAALGASRGHEPLLRQIIAWVGPALALWWFSYRYALSWPRVMLCAALLGAPIAVLLAVPAPWVIGPTYLGLLALTCDVGLGVADERFPTTRSVDFHLEVIH